MRPRARTAVAGMAVIVLALIVAGCGSSGSSGSGAGPLLRAADVTARVPGYRLAATVSVNTPAGAVSSAMTGTVDRIDRTGQFETRETVAGHVVTTTEKFAGTIFYLQAPPQGRLGLVAHGKPWLRLDMSRLLGAVGISALPTSGTDPSQFLDYLRAVSARTTRLGPATIRGVPTTGYRSTIDLNRYPQLVPPADRAATRRGLSVIASALGGHLLPVRAWVDAQHHLRRMVLSLPECVAGQHIGVNLAMDVFDYGPQPAVRVPTAAQSYDLTPTALQGVSKLSLGCQAAT